MATDFAEQFTCRIQKEVEIKAPAADVFEAMLEQIGPASSHPDGTPMPLKLEAWPGGRWYRDLGNNAGHFWGHVQVIKPPTLLELTGPMFMSYPAISHVQYRVKEEGGLTKLTLLHRTLGDVSAEHRKGMSMGYDHIMASIKNRAGR